MELDFSVFLYPEPDDILHVLTWLTSTISYAREQVRVIRPSDG